jgi:phosphotransferase system  glucose/maltose/N-acetylglucosamine-specific IIC component
MTLARWWKQKSGQAKTITLLAVLFTLQIGLCFSTGAITNSLHTPPPHGYDHPMWDLTLMLWQFFICLITLALIVVLAVWWHQGISSSRKKSRQGKND